MLWKPNFSAIFLHWVPFPEPLLPKTKKAFGLALLTTFGKMPMSFKCSSTYSVILSTGLLASILQTLLSLE